MTFSENITLIPKSTKDKNLKMTTLGQSIEFQIYFCRQNEFKIVHTKICNSKTLIRALITVRKKTQKYFVGIFFSYRHLSSNFNFHVLRRGFTRNHQLKKRFIVPFNTQYYVVLRTKNTRGAKRVGLFKLL